MKATGGSASAAIEIALVNNMPDQAVEATQAQFSRLVRRGTQGMAFRLRHYAFASAPRSETARHALMQSHDDIEALYARGADVLIVTGAEPRADVLTNEPYWEDFARLVDWARVNTLACLWSCLAAHGAVLRLDGVARRREPQKISGVFACEIAANDWATRGGDAVLVPHSRHNGLAREDLESCGYRVASWSPRIGVDSFWRREPSLFLFAQGHPEYDADTLAREFRRDAQRFFSGQSDVFPAPPMGYFSPPAERRLAELLASRMDAQSFVEKLGAVLAQNPPAQSWASDAERLYRNWLRTALSEKMQKLRSA